MRLNSNFFRFLCAALLTLAIAIGLAREAMLVIEERTANTNLFMRHRLREMLAAFPKIAAVSDPVALVFGASDMEIEFHPDVFDSVMQERGKKIVSFNLAVRNGPAVFHEIVARVASAKVKPAISIVKFSPDFLTRAVKQTWQVSDDVRAALVSGHELWAQRILFDGMSPSQARYYLSDWLNPDRRFKFSEKSPLIFRNRELNGEPAWDFAQRGFFYFGWPKTKETLSQVFAEYHKPEVQQAVLRYHENCCDAAGLNFDENLLHELIESLQALRAISKETILLYYPDRIARTPEANMRLQKALEKVARVSGAELLQVDGMLKADDFIDPVHLTLEGGQKLTRFLAKALSR
jgi:hypothetical protein